MEETKPEEQPTEQAQQQPAIQQQSQPQAQEQTPQPAPQQQQTQPQQQPKAKPFKETYAHKLKKFLRECRRVFKVTRKPNKEEFVTIAKVSAVGLALIGLIGFALSMVQQLIL